MKEDNEQRKWKISKDKVKQNQIWSLMNVNTFPCTVLWEPLTHPLLFLFYFSTIFSEYSLSQMRRRFTLLDKLHKVSERRLLALPSLTPERPKSATERNCCFAVTPQKKVKSQMKTVNHAVSAIDVSSRVRFRLGSSRVWKIFKDFLSMGFSFIQFHLLLLSSIFQLFTELEWPPSLGLPAC